MRHLLSLLINLHTQVPDTRNVDIADATKLPPSPADIDNQGPVIVNASWRDWALEDGRRKGSRTRAIPDLTPRRQGIRQVWHLQNDQRLAWKWSGTGQEIRQTPGLTT